ncbi:MAG TPA: Crp/Fnr family transcriptional regulator [Gemmatimonadales bacterium]|nr:Crp/Fnr family transcriptional regulator [Gemmatimonadales bacterium]
MPPDPFEVLKSVPLLRQVPEGDLRALALLVRERSHPRGSVILSQGDPGEALFLIRSGQVKVTVVAEDGREVILSVLGPGSFFGEMALVDDEPRSAHVIAMEDSALLQLRRDDFRARLRSAPELAISLLRELSRRLRRADDTIASLMLLDVNGRVAHLLLELAREEGGDSGTRVTRRLTHAAIGQMVGASRETVSRTMRNLVLRSVIAVTRREISLLDPQALRLAAQQSPT